MTKRRFLAAALGVSAASRGRAQDAQAEARPDAGAIAAQVAGRVLLALDGTVQVYFYYLFVDGLGSDLFSGPPSERTAHFTLRTDPVRPVVTFNGDIAHMGFQPGGGEGLYRIYYNPSPGNRDFTRPDTFAQGAQIAAFRARRTQATLMPGSHAMVSGTADLASSTEITFRDRAFDVKDLYRSIS